MAKVRVYELAKELDIGNKELLERLSAIGVKVERHVNSLEDDVVEIIRSHFKDNKEKTDDKTAKPFEEKRIKGNVIRRRPRISKEDKKQEVKPEEEIIAEMPVENKSEVILSDEVLPEISEDIDIHAHGIDKVKDEEAIQEPVMVKEAEAVKDSDTIEELEIVKDHDTIKETVKIEEKDEPESVKKADDVSKPPAEKAKKVKKTKKKKPVDTPAKIIKLPEKIVIQTESKIDKKKVEDVGGKVEPRVKETKKSVFVEEVVDRSEKTQGRKNKKGKRSDKDTDDNRLESVKKRKYSDSKEIIETTRLYRKKYKKNKKGASQPETQHQTTQITQPKAIKRRIKIGDAITVAELARRMGIKSSELIKVLMSLQVMVTVNQSIDFDTASLIVPEFGFELEKVSFEEEDVLAFKEPASGEENKAPRPPVVTIMGHVDHGKTSLLDKIRHTDVIAGEAGGITQHIGAYNVKLSSGNNIVFLDTPGHEAFTAMRARGAKVTDVVVLVIAADDGVKQQTFEAVNHANAAELPIIVAINKIDKPGANIDKVKKELADIGLIPEEWGGQTTMVEVSAKTGEGLDELLELISLQTEILELKADPEAHAIGSVIEAKLDKGRGPVATILVQNGTLKTGDIFVCGLKHGRIRALINDKGKNVNHAPPSMPVEVIGMSGVPLAGDRFVVVESEKVARQVADYRRLKHRELELSKATRVNLENLFEYMKEGETKELNIILKADVQGSIEAIMESLKKLSTDSVKLNFLHNGVGAVNDTDVNLALASEAIIIGFNVRATPNAQLLAESEKIDLRYYDIIYKIIDDIKLSMRGVLDPVFNEVLIGRAEVRQVFSVPKIGIIAGSYVIDGVIKRGCKARLLRDNVLVYDGQLTSLRRFKDDAKEVKSGFECGIGLENYNDIKVDDVIEAYTLEEIIPEL